MKGLIIISSLALKYTSEMEKAMQKSHGIGYVEYGLKLQKILKVEKRRELDYKKSQTVVAEATSNIHG